MANYTPHNEQRPLSERGQRMPVRSAIYTNSADMFGDGLLFQFPDLLQHAQAAPEREQPADVVAIRPSVDVRPDVAGAVINTAVQASTAYEQALEAQRLEVARITGIQSNEIAA